VYETLASQLSSALKGAKLERKRKHLEKEITEISRKEQMRIGQDLHDGLCQHITGISFMCKVLRDQLRQKSLPEALSADEICSLLNESIATTRSLAKGLFPVELEENGLVVALQELVLTLERQSRITCQFLCTDSISIADNAMASNLFRIAQEAITNAIKHAEAKNIYVELSEKEGKVSMKIRDDGIGLPENIHGKGIGLATMKYRANIIGAKLAITRARGGGTEVSCLFRNRAIQETGKTHKR
jgi:two-component system sensor kinase FixL